jgi:thiamine biosynthesis lipoprotein ApbE
MEVARDSIRRARPLLGTFVEIAVAGAKIEVMEAAVEAAFSAVAAVHRLMSFHEANSDVSRLNRDAASNAVRVHDWTYRVLETARDLNRRSAGMFDIAVAPALQRLGLLPSVPARAPPSPRSRGEGASPHVQTYESDVASAGTNRGRRATFESACLRAEEVGPSPTLSRSRGSAGSGRFRMSELLERPPLPDPLRSPSNGSRLWRARRQAPTGVNALMASGEREQEVRAHDIIQLLPKNHVRFADPLVKIDLGGIAKGFAVDRAVEALRHHDVAEGLVNAGGDLRTFGTQSHDIDIRDPRQPDRPMCRVALRNAALASSASRFDPLRSRHVFHSGIIDPATAMPVRSIRGATVCAPSCMIADALTKVVMNIGETAAPILEHYGADALFMSAHDDVHMTANWKNEVHLAA